MGKIMKSEVKPQNEKVFIEIALNNDNEGIKIDSSKRVQHETGLYTAKVLAIGPRALDEEEGCPGLEVGDTVMISEFAGTNVPTEDGYTKVVEGHNIIIMSKNNLDIENIIPTGKRLLVEILDEDLVQEEGVSYNKSFDPRERETQKGRVVKCGELADQYPEGTIVYFDPFVGNIVINEPKRKFKTLFCFDIEFTI